MCNYFPKIFLCVEISPFYWQEHFDINSIKVVFTTCAVLLNKVHDTCLACPPTGTPVS